VSSGRAYSFTSLRLDLPVMPIGRTYFPISTQISLSLRETHHILTVAINSYSIFAAYNRRRALLSLRGCSRKLSLTAKPYADWLAASTSYLKLAGAIQQHRLQRAMATNTCFTRAARCAFAPSLRLSARPAIATPTRIQQRQWRGRMFAVSAACMTWPLRTEFVGRGLC